MINETVLRREEKAEISLRSLYARYGYLPYRMSKFEEYELYMKNKDFLVSDQIITFNDTNGRLLALKPDVTLSIIKNGEDEPGCKQKVYYSENVYRVSEKTGKYKEIMQTGVECIGAVDIYDIYESIKLAAESLSLISKSFVLDISHLGIMIILLEKVCDDNVFRRKALHFIAEKNAHDMKKLCDSYQIPAEQTDVLQVFIRAYGQRNKVIAQLEEAVQKLAPDCEKVRQVMKEIKTLSALLETSPLSSKIRFDFSIVNDMNYYNDFAFKGFINGISDGVLAGGQYDKLMKKMDRKDRAVGFAINLDLLEQMKQERREYDVDIVILYDENTDVRMVAQAVSEAAASGKTASAQKQIPEKLRYREIADLRKGTPIC